MFILVFVALSFCYVVIAVQQSTHSAKKKCIMIPVPIQQTGLKSPNKPRKSL